MPFVKLLDLAICTPPYKARPRIPHVDFGDFRKPSCGIELGGTLVCDRRTVGETVLVCRTYRRFVEMFGVQHPIFDARDLSTDQRGSGFKIRRTVQRPYVELLVMLLESGEMCRSSFWRSRIPGGSMRQGGIETKVTGFHLRRCRPEQMMGSPGRLDSRGVISGEKACLQLSRPIEEFGESQHRIGRQATFRVRFVVVVGVKASERGRQAAKRTDETLLRLAILDHQPEASFSDKLQALLHLGMHLLKRVAHGQIVGDQLVPAIGREREVSRSIRDIERSPY